MFHITFTVLMMAHQLYAPYAIYHDSAVRVPWHRKTIYLEYNTFLLGICYIV